MSAPPVDTGDPVGAGSMLLQLFAPSADRARNSALSALSILLVLAIFETFRLPDTGVAVFFVLMMEREDAVSTVGSSLVIAIGLSVGTLIAAVDLAASLSQPALRLAIMAGLSFATMFCMRASTLGMPCFLAGFIAVYSSTQADEIANLALSTGQVVNAEGAGLPQIAFMPPEEALLHSVLWFAAPAVIPALVTLMVSRLLGRDPATLLRRALAGRMDACARFCRGEPDGGAVLVAAARDGTAPLLKLLELTERAHNRADRHEADIALVRALQRVVLLLLAWRDAGDGSPAAAAALERVGLACERIAARIRAGRGGVARVIEAYPGSPAPDDGAASLGGALPALAAELRRTLDAARAADAARQAPGTAAVAAAFRFFRPGAFNAANTQFALKVTLAVMVAYTLESTLAWQAVGTCVVTAFFTALGTVGESVYKMVLRIVGATVGGALGIATILLLMPSMTGLAQLAALVGAVAFVSAWIGYGSPRISYAGWQVLLAYTLTTLQGYGPTLDMQTARDRVIGILIGNVVTALCLLFIWPVRVGAAVRASVAGALDALSAMAALGTKPVGNDERAAEGALRDRFAGGIAQAGALIPNDDFEPGHAPEGTLGRDGLSRLARLIVPLSVIATDGLSAERLDEVPSETRDAVRAHQQGVADWLGGAARWIRTGEGAETLRAAIPAPPALSRPAATGTARRVAAREALYALLARDLRSFADSVLPRTAVAGPGGSLAAE